MFGPQYVRFCIKVDEIPITNVHCAQAYSRFTRVETVKVNQLLERVAKLLRIIVADRFQRAWWIEIRQQTVWIKEPPRAAKQRTDSAQLVYPGPSAFTPKDAPPSVASSDLLPKLAQAQHSSFRSISGYNRSVDGTN